ncbi:unnamed protein product [Adineta ricciae]|uniref:Uncharacterized protein n=1 Tax=Adineta ricciae TaxID=249248 RepID=A0A815QBI1_ADIRI|nr:unnamed protein product [Adineta ricciae]CAF1600293.1 unnamed protein product [Adineta ricciae]
MYFNRNSFLIVGFVSLTITMRIVDGCRSLSVNQPKLCPTVKWNLGGLIYTDWKTVGIEGVQLFIDTINTGYVYSNEKDQILVWFKDNPRRMIIGYKNYNEITSIFAQVIDDRFGCYDLFIDIYDRLYCALFYADQVVKRLLNDDDEVEIIIVAGTNTTGSGPHELDGPRRIFVDTNFDLYVADVFNDRIQLFRLGDQSGTTVAGQSSLDITTILSSPDTVVLLYLPVRN